MSTSPTIDALRIPYPDADEAHQLMQVSFDRLLAVLDALPPEAWSLPTACTAWDVRQMVAHQAGGYAAGTGYGEMLRQFTAIPRKGELPEDAINRRQVRERADKKPQELIDELRRVGAPAIHNWAYGFRLIKPIAVPHPVGGWFSMRHLMWVIHSRDTWMHRLDICRAAGLSFEQTAEHDGRIAGLVMRDVALQLQPRLEGKALLFDLTGVAGGRFQAGEGEPVATVQMDVLEFNIFASGRYSFDEARNRWTISGDASLAEALLRKMLVLY